MSWFELSKMLQEGSLQVWQQQLQQHKATTILDFIFFFVINVVCKNKSFLVEQVQIKFMKQNKIKIKNKLFHDTASNPDFS